MPSKLGVGSIVWWSLPDSIPVQRSAWDAKFPGFSLDEHSTETVAARELADVLVRYLRGRCLAIRLRKMGGDYFVPNVADRALALAAQVIRGVGGVVYSLPIEVGDRATTALQPVFLADLEMSRDTAAGAIKARHKVEAALEAQQALDRLAYYETALNMGADVVGTLRTQFTGLLADALVDKRAGGRKEKEE